MGGDLTICVVGLGYVGLPTAIAFHRAGFRVFGVDVSKEVIDSIESGESHLSDGSSDLEIPMNSETWSVSQSFEDSVIESDVVLITVPTPVNSDRTPDLSIVESAMRSVLESMADGRNQIIVVESTVFPGATMRIARSIEAEMSHDFPKHVKFAYSPERVSPGEVGKSAENIAKIVGSNDEETGLFLADIYSKITEKGCEYVGPIEVAEAAKMIENTQRDIDIAFMNELAKILPEMGLDVMEVIDAASTKWNFHRHTPGIGVGGHCIPVDPYYYIQSSRDAGIGSILSPSAREINESMPKHSAAKIARHLSPDKEVMILGLAYKPNVGDTRESPVIGLIVELSRLGIKSRIWDPMVTSEVKLPDGAKIVNDPYRGAEGAGMVVLATAHTQCKNLDWERIGDLVSEAKLFDGPRTLDRDLMESIGFEYSGVGVPDEQIS